MSLALLNAELAVVTVARSFRWVRETHGANRGEVVDQITRTAGLDPALRPPWCASFVAYVGRATLGAKWPLQAWASCDRLFEEATALQLVRATPVRGAIFGLWRPGDLFYHVGFVGELVRVGLWRTVEGNTTDDGSAEGIGVFERERTFSDTARFIHWWL